MELNNAIKLSILIPAHNAEDTILCTLKSISGNSLEKTEIIVVNDASTDETVKTINSLDRKNIKVINLEQNIGPFSALNYGLETASGEYITFIDADDWYDLDFLDTIHKIISDFNSDLIIFGMRNIRDNYEINTFPKFDENNFMSEFVLDKITCSKVNKVYKKSIIDLYNITFRDTARGVDGTFNMDYFVHIEKVYKLNKIFYNYDQRRPSITRKNFSFEVISDHENMLKRDLKAIQEHLSIDYRDELDVRRFRFIVIFSIFRLYNDFKAGYLENDFLRRVKKYISEEFQINKILQCQYISIKEKVLYLSFLLSPKISFFLLKKFNY